MSIRNLDALFSPTSIAVFGASKRPGSVGATVWRNLSADYTGHLYPVNPKHASLDGVKCYARATTLPEAPELAVICTPVATVAPLIAQLGARGTRAAIVITAGLDKAQKQAMLDAARPHTLRILGPNCIGMLAPHLGLNASFSHIGAIPGEIAFVSQSGALVTAMLDWAGSRGIGFSHFVSLGEHADVDFGDMLDFLGSDPKTRAILLYIESVEESPKFMSAARAAARNKPVIVVKAGRSAAGQAAAASHTGALAGSDAVFDAAIARAGMLRVNSLQDLFLAAETLSRFRDGPSGGLIVLTNGGGAGVMAADAAASEGVPLTPLSPEVLKKLNAVLPPNWSHSNPVDIIGDAPGERYVNALEALKSETDSAVLFIQAPTAIVPSTDIANALLPSVTQAPRRVLGSWLGEGAVKEARQIFRSAGVPDYDTPEEAVRAFAMLRTYRCHQEELLQTPPARSAARPVDMPRIRAIVDAVIGSGRELLTEPEAKDLLDAAGLPVVATRVVAPEVGEAVTAASALGYPVALKILSHAISHKSDVGGVRLNIGNEAELKEACAAMLDRVRELRPDADVQGFTVQRMIKLKHAHELIIGASVDPVFGPIILFGQGGTAVEVLADRALALPPLNTPLALAQIERTRSRQAAARLPRRARRRSRRHRAGAGLRLAVAGRCARNRRARHQPPAGQPRRRGGAGRARSRIGPVPRRGETLRHPALPASAGGNLAPGKASPSRCGPSDPKTSRNTGLFWRPLDPEDIRLRIFYSRRSIEHSELARLTQIDYAREMAFIATRHIEGDGEETLGAVRATIDPDNIAAEFGVIVRSDTKGSGLGTKLMEKLIAYLRQRGTQRIVGTVLRENKGMLELAKRLGFEESANPSDPGDHTTRFVSLDLQQTT